MQYLFIDYVVNKDIILVYINYKFVFQYQVGDFFIIFDNIKKLLRFFSPDINLQFHQETYGKVIKIYLKMN